MLKNWCLKFYMQNDRIAEVSKKEPTVCFKKRNLPDNDQIGRPKTPLAFL